MQLAYMERFENHGKLLYLAKLIPNIVTLVMLMIAAPVSNAVSVTVPP